jgi:transposase
MSKPKLTKELLFQKYHIENKSMTEVAQDLGYSRQHVYRTMKKFGLESRSVSDANSGSGNSQYKEGPWRDPEVLNELIQKNMTTREMAEELGISHSTLARSLRKLGLKTKRKKAYTRLSPEESKLARMCPDCSGKKAYHASVCHECHDQSGVNNPMYGKKHSNEARRKVRLAWIKRHEGRKGQLVPSYNPGSIPIIENYGRKNGFKFQHAENLGEYRVKELGYFLDAYDKENNVALEIDEWHHYDKDGNLRKKDLIRQREIMQILKCKFVRINFETGETYVYEEN